MPEQRESIKGQVTTSEIGVIHNGFVGTFNQEEELNLTDVTVDKLAEMTRKDGQAAALMRILTLPIKSAKWDITGDADMQREIDFVRENFTRPPHRGGMSTPMSYVIGHMAKAVRDGFSVFEKVWRIDEDGHIRYKKLAPRASNTITFLTDEHGGFAGVRQRAFYKGKFYDVTIPPEKCLVYTVNKEENPLYGQSLLLPAYYHYDKKHKLYYIANLAYLVTAVPIRLGEIPEGMQEERPDLVAAFRQALADIGLNTAVTFPQGFKVDKFEAQRALADFMPLINHHDLLMAKSVLSQFIELGTGGNSGAYALSRDHSDLFVVGLEGIMKEIADTITWYAIPDLIDYNFASGKYPRFEFEPLTDSTTRLLKDVFSEVMRAQEGRVSDDFLLQLEREVAGQLGLEIDYDAVEAKRKAEMEMMREAQAQAAADLRNAVAKVGGRADGDARLSELLQEIDKAIECLTEFKE